MVESMYEEAFKDLVTKLYDNNGLNTNPVEGVTIEGYSVYEGPLTRRLVEQTIAEIRVAKDVKRISDALELATRESKELDDRRNTLDRLKRENEEFFITHGNG